MGAPDHHVAVVCIRRRVGAATPLELRVGIVGNVDSGKTTMVCSFGLVSNRIMSSLLLPVLLKWRRPCGGVTVPMLCLNRMLLWLLLNLEA